MLKHVNKIFAIILSPFPLVYVYVVTILNHLYYPSPYFVDFLFLDCHRIRPRLYYGYVYRLNAYERVVALFYNIHVGKVLFPSPGKRPLPSGGRVIFSVLPRKRLFNRCCACTTSACTWWIGDVSPSQIGH